MLVIYEFVLFQYFFFWIELLFVVLSHANKLKHTHSIVLLNIFMKMNFIFLHVFQTVHFDKMVNLLSQMTL